jgi:hypothetical protein
MSWPSDAGRAILASSLFFLCASVIAFGGPVDDFARETGLDTDLIGVIQVDVGGTEMTIAFVFINERALDSRVAPALRQALEPYVGRNALYVNPSVRGAVSHFDFDPRAITVQGEGRERATPPASAWVELTLGFLGGAFKVNPAGASQGSGSEGVLVLGDLVESTKPFDVFYGDQRTTFAIGADGAPGGTAPSGAASGLSHDPISVPALASVSSLEEVLALPDLTEVSLAALFALDRSLVRILDTAAKTDAVRFVFIQLEESVRASALGDDLLSRLDQVIGTGAVMMWATSTTGAPFSPWYFYVQQSGTNFVFFSSASFVELTSGFLALERLEPATLAAAVIRLPKGVNAKTPFAVRYGSLGVTYP